MNDKRDDYTVHLVGLKPHPLEYGLVGHKARWPEDSKLEDEIGQRKHVEAQPKSLHGTYGTPRLVVFLLFLGTFLLRKDRSSFFCVDISSDLSGRFR